jgi:myo-inositol-1(or 4)-monophosphatase
VSPPSPPPAALDGRALLALKDVLVPRARELGRWAADLADRHHGGDDVLEIATKSDPGDVVTFADGEVQRRLVTTLRDVLPGAAFLGEEGLDEPSRGAPTWVIDPIDGTHNYVRGYPGFCVSVGLVVGDESVLGVIYDALEDAAYWAVAGEGAWRDDRRLTGPTPSAMDHALVSTTIYPKIARVPAVERTLIDLAQRAAGVRSSGSACRDLCLVAAGRLDLFWQAALNPWDVAAGLAIVREAGAVMTFAEGAEGWVRSSALTVFAGAAPLVDEALGFWDANGSSA